MKNRHRKPVLNDQQACHRARTALGAYDGPSIATAFNDIDLQRHENERLQTELNHTKQLLDIARQERNHAIELLHQAEDRNGA